MAVIININEISYCMSSVSISCTTQSLNADLGLFDRLLSLLLLRDPLLSLDLPGDLQELPPGIHGSLLSIISLK